MPIGVFLITRSVQLLVLAWTGNDPGNTVWNRLLSWDSGWFVRVASEGYPQGYTYDDSGVLLGNGLAFLPGYPLLIRAFLWLGFSDQVAPLLASTLAALVAVVLIYLLGKDLHGRRFALALVFCLGALPMSVVLSMGYSESLFLAFAAGSLLAMRRQAWLTAGLCAAGACLTRVVGVAACIALVVALVLFLRAEWRRADGPRLDVKVWLRIGGGLLAAAVALPLYWWWVDARVGDDGAWFAIQDAGWSSRWDFGQGTFAFLEETLRAGDGWVPVSTAVLILVSLALLVAAAFDRPWPPLLAYGVVIVAMALGTDGYYHSKLRLLVPALVLLVPVAKALSRARPRIAVPLAATGLLFGTWYGAHMITVWHYAI
ncbi:ArnT family glycosyltransferase [Phytomonospora endophytica]|uniref:4-amino-4-deoxy-L-arabinose transferase-like glycosyltransferase n=1 Tax=Phytomonospora endophytica TaxID=714109 RepID=A0A841FQ66_9ACTN|nr:glycosyltransferase family 39 protein [Phytomonospora endophytica]MBB6034699.1 4-amino-4-deoxy-L-arabinose transferase-like glycosyltransferase [Phytomonospora endophytica]